MNGNVSLTECPSRVYFSLLSRVPFDTEVNINFRFIGTYTRVYVIFCHLFFLIFDFFVYFVQNF